MIESKSDALEKQNAARHPLDYMPTAFDRWIVHIGHVLAVCYLITVFITGIEVFMRYFFDAPTQWVFEVSIMLVGTTMLYGGAYCMSNNGHIRVTVIVDLLPISIQRWIHVLIALLTLLFMLSLCYAAGIMTQNAFFNPKGDWRIESSGSAYNSFLPAELKLMLFVTVILMAIQSVLQFGQAIVQAIKGVRGHA